MKAVCWWDNRPVHLLATGGSVEQDRVVNLYDPGLKFIAANGKRTDLALLQMPILALLLSHGTSVKRSGLRGLAKKASL